MRKKYLSALLFGALLVTSAGTFTSCKDYDDEINNLQEQITANADAIKALQDKIGDGKFVTNIASESNGLKITWNDGSSTVIENVINGEDQKGDVVSIDPETGEIKINNKGTGFYASKGEGETPEEAKLPYVNEEGVLVIFDENGEEVVTGIRVSPVTAVINEDGSAVLTIIAADGTKQTINIPSAASMISSIIIADENNTLTVYNEQFNFDGKGIISEASDWKGTKSLPAKGSYIISTDKIDIRINPVAADISDVDFYLTNSLNKDVPSIVLSAEAESGKDAITAGDIKGRAGNVGNGLWGLSMANTVITKDAFENEKTGLEGYLNASIDDNNVVYALNAAHSCRSLYEVQLLEGEFTIFDRINFTQQGDETQTGSEIDVKVGSPVTVGVYNSSSNADVSNSLYDMYLEADASDVEVYGLTIDQANHTFTVGKNPDISSVEAKFTLNVYTVNVKGEVAKNTVTVNLDSQLSTATEYTTITHNVAVNANKNYFGIDLSIMKTDLGDNLNTWLQNVDLTAANIEYKWSDKKDNITGSIPTGFELDVVEKLVDIPVGGVTGVTDRNKANFIQVSIDNASTNGLLDLDKEYYIKVTFKAKTGGVLNSIIVPVKFTAPAFADLFKKEPAVFINNGNVAHAYLNVEDASVYSNEAAYSFENAFVEIPNDVTYSISDEKFSDEYKFSDLARISKDNKAVALNKEDVDIDNVTGIPAGYKKEIKVIAKSGINSGSYVYNGTRWKYAEGKESYTFNIMIMSPIFEGTVSAINDVVTIPATGSSYKLGNKDIQGTTYNAIKYNVLPDAYNTASDWSREEITNVEAISGNERVFKVGSLVKATQDEEGNITEGYFEVTPMSISQTSQSTMQVTVTDIWGYKKVSDINVKITVGE